jgi:phage baseplate assembly protein W
MITQLTDIRSRDFSKAIGEFGQVAENIDDINQCLRAILKSPKGSRPHAPLFGCDAWRYLDRPMGAAIPQIVREVAEAIEAWEPRVELMKITPDFTEAAAGYLHLSIEWKLTGATESRTTEVRL